MTLDSTNGLLARVKELERVRDREEEEHRRLWNAITREELARATFEAKAEERQREIREDVAEVRRAIDTLSITIKANEKARDEREEKRAQGTFKSKLAYIGAAAVVVASLIGAIAQVVGHP